MFKCKAIHVWMDGWKESTHPHEHQGLCARSLSLWHVDVHFVNIKVSVVWRAHTLIETESAPRQHFDLLYAKICIPRGRWGY